MDGIYTYTCSDNSSKIAVRWHSETDSTDQEVDKCTHYCLYTAAGVLSAGELRSWIPSRRGLVQHRQGGRHRGQSRLHTAAD